MTATTGRKTPDPIDVAVGGRARLRRRELKLTQAALAAKLGVTFQQLQKYERGDNRVSASRLVGLAAALNTTVADLVGERDPEFPRHHLQTPGAIDLLRAYAAISSPHARDLLRGVAGVMAGLE